MVGAMSLLWSLATNARAEDAQADEISTPTGFVDNSRCALGSHWIQTTRKPGDGELTRIAEWVTAKGPTRLHVVPQFRCVSARLQSDTSLRGNARSLSEKDYGGADLWCGPGLSVVLVWEVFGGEGPYTVRAAGYQATSPDDTLTIPCTAVRATSGQLHLREHGSIDIRVQLLDSLGVASGVEIPVRILADAPIKMHEGMRLTAGWHEASALSRHDDWFEGHLFEPTGPFIPAAAGRCRPVGTKDWIYFNLSARLPQSDRGFHYPPIMGPLEVRTLYEVQGAWVWTALPNCSYEGCRGLESWRDWTSPLVLDWSDMQQFRTSGPLCPIVDAANNSLTIKHSERVPAEKSADTAYKECALGAHRVMTWLTSSDWPGVIWAYPFRGSAPTQDDALLASERFIARYSGLPENSAFEVHMQEPMPHNFHQPPIQSLSISTGERVGAETSPGVDPTDIMIRAGADQIIVEWTDQGPFLSSSVWLKSQRDTELSATEQRYRDGSRIGIVFSGLGTHREFDLYVSFPSVDDLPDGTRYPGMCVIREIHLPPGGPDAYLDRYLWAPSDQTLVKITPAAIPRIHFDYPYNYHLAGPCQLGLYSFP